MKQRLRSGSEPLTGILNLIPSPVVTQALTRLAGMGFDSIVVDKLLAHKPARLKGVAAVYQRHEFMDERRRALEAWAAHLTRPPGATILPFRAAEP